MAFDGFSKSKAPNGSSPKGETTRQRQGSFPAGSGTPASSSNPFAKRTPPSFDAPDSNTPGNFLSPGPVETQAPQSPPEAAPAKAVSATSAAAVTAPAAADVAMNSAPGAEPLPSAQRPSSQRPGAAQTSGEPAVLDPRLEKLLCSAQERFQWSDPELDQARAAGAKDPYAFAQRLREIVHRLQDEAITLPGDVALESLLHPHSVVFSYLFPDTRAIVLLPRDKGADFAYTHLRAFSWFPATETPFA